MYPLVEYETNKYITNSYHQKLYQEKYNLEKFIAFIKNNKFHEHKDYNQISKFFQPSIEIIGKEILDDLVENGLKRKKPRLELFLKDLENIIDIYNDILEDFDLSNIQYFYKSVKKNIMSNNSDIELAKADIINLLQEYRLIEKSIITFIIHKMAKLVSKNYTFILYSFWYHDDETKYLNNITEEKIERYFALLLVILMSKNITKKEVIELFTKLCSYSNYYSYISNDGIYFDSKYPLDLENNYKNLSEYRFNIMNVVNNLTIEERFNRFIELLYEEKECFYIFNILNAKIDTVNEVKYGDVTYYTETIFKAKGYQYNTKFDRKDSFRGDEEVKAIIPFKTNRYFSNISILKVRKIVENNISFLKLFTNTTNEKDNYFKPSPSKMYVSYSHFVLDENYYILSSSSTVYDGDFTFNKNAIYPKIYKNDEFQKNLNSYLTHLNYKQIESSLTSNDSLILQSLQKYKQSAEAASYSDSLLYTWNGLEFLSKAFTTRNDKLLIIQELVALVYSFIYINKFHRWDLSNKNTTNEINRRAENLVVYVYTYRNKLVHSHLIENSFMISLSKGINIIFREILSLMIDKIIVNPDFIIEDVINQIKSDLNKSIEELSDEKRNESK